jgi:hypothetical protein
MDKELIAPCGMNCGLCSNYLAMKNDLRTKGLKLPYCKGCRPRDKQCSFIKKKCERLRNHDLNFCYECTFFPCNKLLGLQKAYVTLYHVSMVENLTFIKMHGIDKFLENQKTKWRCPDCGGVLCCHNGICYSCGLEKLKLKKKMYRWEE